MAGVIRHCPGSFGNYSNSCLADSAFRAANRARCGNQLHVEKLVAVFEFGWGGFSCRRRGLGVAKFEALVEQSFFNRSAFYHFYLRLVCAAKSF